MATPPSAAQEFVIHAAAPTYDGIGSPVQATFLSSPSISAVAAIAKQLSMGYWQSIGQDWAKFAARAGSTLNVDISGLTAEGATLARLALDAWSQTTGLLFNTAPIVGATIQLTFDDDQANAFATRSVTGNTITSAHVNVGLDWLQSYGTGVNSYSMQTYIHEVGHALGLGHAGNYNGTASFSRDAKFALDSWQLSIMSYFSQAANRNVDASFAYALTPMMADLVAMQGLYGNSTRVGSGATTYGIGSNAGELHAAIGDLMSGGTLGTPIAMTIIDRSGIDVFDFSTDIANQAINLTPGSISSIYGYRGNLLIEAKTVIENLYAGHGSDQIRGNDVANKLFGNDGNDTLEGGKGNDTLEGGSGQDALVGGLNNDSLFGGAGYDWLNGELGDDKLYGGDDGDTLLGATGVDQLYGGEGWDSLDGGDGADRIYGGGGWDVIYGGRDSDLLYGEGDFDTIYGGDGQDAIYGGDSFDSLYGGAGHDRITGGNDSDYIDGGKDNDTLDGGLGIDFVYGDDGNDSIFGKDDIDYLYGGAGNDVIYGGNDIDYLYGGVGNNTLSGGDGIDFLYAEVGNNRMSGDGGSDHFFAGAGNDQIYGGDDVDFIYADDGNDIISGGNGNDYVYGGAGNDTIKGDIGDDLITGGTGVDLISGGIGADTFIFDDLADSAAQTFDTIRDFVSGTDHISLQLNLAGAINFIGTSAFSGTQTELGYSLSRAGAMVELDANGDGVADFALLLSRVVTLSSGDFYL